MQEALEQSKKRTKQRQKEKKKAKKQAKKDEEDSFDNNNGFTADNETDLNIKLEKVSLKPSVLNESPTNHQKFHEDYIQEPLTQTIDQAQLKKIDSEDHHFNKLQKENLKDTVSTIKEAKPLRASSKKMNTNGDTFSKINASNKQDLSEVINSKNSKNGVDEWFSANRKKSTVCFMYKFINKYLGCQAYRSKACCNFKYDINKN